MEFVWNAPDGETFPIVEWLPEGKPSGVLICVPGMGGAASDFGPVGEMAAGAGFAVFAINLRGQGLDKPERRGNGLDLAHIGTDIAAFAEMACARYPGVPLFFCGESMGSLIVAWILAHERHPLPVRGAIFSVPVVELSRPTPWLIRQALRMVSYVLPRTKFSAAWFVNGKAGPLKITRDEAHWERIKQSPHYIPVFSFRFLNNIGDLIESSTTLAHQVKTPCLVLAAGHDVFLRAEQVEAWYGELAARDKTYRLYPEAYHLLWHDWDKEAVLKDIREWLETRR